MTSESIPTSLRRTSQADSPAAPIVVGYDSSPSSDAAFDRGIELAHALSAPLRVVAAWQYPTTYGGYPVVGWSPEEDAQIMLDAAVRQRYGSDVPSWLTVRTGEGSAAHVLIGESATAQMLVVGSRGHGGFVGLLLGSVSSACAEHAECPVLVMHTPKTSHETAIDAGSEALGHVGPAPTGRTPAAVS